MVLAADDAARPRWHRPWMRPLLLSLLAAGALAATVTASPAAADSVVYVKDGNLHLVSPDGSKGYQLTFDGGWSSPSQADDGTIGAIHNKQLVRLDRSGRPRNAPIDTIGSPGAGAASRG